MVDTSQEHLSLWQQRIEQGKPQNDKRKARGLLNDNINE